MPAPNSLKAAVETLRSYRDLLYLFQAACVHTDMPIEKSPPYLCYAALQKKITLVHAYMENVLYINLRIQRIYAAFAGSYEFMDTEDWQPPTLLLNMAHRQASRIPGGLAQGFNAFHFSNTTALATTVQLPEMVEILHQEHLFFVQNANGSTVLHLAAHQSIGVLKKLFLELWYLGMPERIKLLHIVNKQGWTALIEAIHYGAKTHVKWLLCAGSDVDYIPNTAHGNNWPPIAHAVASAPTADYSACLDVLIRHNANVNIHIGPSATALTLACHMGNFFSVRQLVAAGAAIVLKNCDEKQQPISIARREGHVAIADWLQQVYDNSQESAEQAALKRQKTR